MVTPLQIILLAIVQGAAELLPVSSSAHVIIGEKLMGLDPSTPEMSFLLVMLHTGTMFAVILYFWKKWILMLNREFIVSLVIATLSTAVVGGAMLFVIERVILGHGEVESLFRNLPLIAGALFAVGIFILFSDRNPLIPRDEVNAKDSIWIGAVQGICLPFRGFSRSGATISTALMQGISRVTAENFSFALAVIITPPVILREALRLRKTLRVEAAVLPFLPGVLGMCFSFIAGLVALRLLSSVLENGKWRYFGFYCFAASIGVMVVHLTL